MNIKHHRKTETYKPNRLRLIGLSFKSINYNSTMLKWLVVIVIITFLSIKIVSKADHYLRSKSPELLNSLKEASSILGLVKPAPKTSPTQRSPSIRLKEKNLHLLDPLAKFYLEVNRDSVKPQTKSDRPWLLQGLADEVTKDPENRRIIKQWIRSLKQKRPADELDESFPYDP